MKKLALVLILPIALSACGGTRYLPTDELRALKPACAGGDAAVCADIGHSIRRMQAEADYRAANPS